MISLQLKQADIVEIVAKLEAEEAQRKTVTETIVPPPSPRSNFSLISHPEKEELILFGGEFYNGQTLTVYNELFVYNIPKNEWKQITTRAGPAARCAHQMVAVANDGGQLWVSICSSCEPFRSPMLIRFVTSYLAVSMLVHHSCSSIITKISGCTV